MGLPFDDIYVKHICILKGFVVNLRYFIHKIQCFNVLSYKRYRVITYPS